MEIIAYQPAYKQDFIDFNAAMATLKALDTAIRNLTLD